jgi:hypothetical protein
VSIPDEVRIGPYTYKIVYRDELYDDQGQQLWGCVSFQEQTIKLLGPDGVSADRQGAAFFHEVLHALMELIGQQIPEETHVALSLVLYAFLKANGYLAR